LQYIKLERIFLKSHAEFNEKWVQDRIAEDPSLLGLGDLVLKDKERIHAHAGRLDLLLQDLDSTRRYEVEIQLGKTDESHIIRTIEYWDIERKRYPQYDHTAVIVAEDITSRFLNVISLFNGSIPLIAIQMQALKIENQISLVFTTVLSERTLGLIDDDEEVQETADRAYWEKRASRATVSMADELFEMVRKYDKDLELKYNKAYIGLVKQGQPNNFVRLRPKKDALRLELRMEASDEIKTKLENSGLDIMEYSPKWGYYRIRIAEPDMLKTHQTFLHELLEQAYDESQK